MKIFKIITICLAYKFYCCSILAILFSSYNYYLKSFTYFLQ